METKRLIVDVLNILGFSCLIGMSVISVLIFHDIYYNGRFIAVEPNIYILALEFILSLYGIIFGIYKLYSYPKDKRNVRFFCNFNVTKDSMDESGAISCPKCNNWISPKDYSGENYVILGYGSSDVYVLCKKCSSVIKISA